MLLIVTLLFAGAFYWLMRFLKWVWGIILEKAAKEQLNYNKRKNGKEENKKG